MILEMRMRYLLLGITVLVLVSACSGITGGDSSIQGKAIKSPNKTHEVEISHYAIAPELVQSVWLNTDTPLKIKDLLGNVVLIDFWTSG
jgi:uncharacterized protein YceK